MSPQALLFVLAFTAALYAWLGEPNVAWMDYQFQAEVAREQPNIDRLKARVKESPEELIPWVLLGSAYMKTARYAAGAEAYKRAVVLSGGEPGLILQYNKALIFAAGGEVTDEAKKGMEMALKLDPGNPEARYFLAIRKLQDDKAEEAMKDMKSLYKELEPGSPLKMLIDSQIGRTK